MLVTNGEPYFPEMTGDVGAERIHEEQHAFWEL
jgi:hypothetical protein